MQHDAGTALGALHVGDFKLAGAFAGPAHAFARRQASTPALDRDAVGDDEARIKTDAELANQLRVVFLVA